MGECDLHWTIGNECYGSWENDTNTHKQDAITYADVHEVRDEGDENCRPARQGRRHRRVG